MTLTHDECAVHNALFGGCGTVRVWNVLTEHSEPFSAVLWCELSPGGSVGPHVQQEFPEIIVGLSGDGEARVNGEPRTLSAGETVFLPLGAVLAIINRSNERPLCYLIVKACAT